MPCFPRPGGLGVTLALALGPPAAADAQPASNAPRNLQVLPKDLPRDSVTRIMRGFSLALGVRCAYCHVPDRDAAPGGPERLDFASDDKVEKRTARLMLRMVDSLNGTFFASLPRRGDPPVRLDCVTCHRGSPLPRTLGSVLALAVEREGVDSAVARYRALRGDAASGRYDFGELTVNDLARSLTASGKTGEALTLLRMNQEYFPNSAAVDLLLADAHLARGERDSAVARLRVALVKEPNNQQARRRLDGLLTPR